MWITHLNTHSQVPEEIVLNDQVGLHLGAGPYLLFYSRAMENEGPALQLPWMDDIKVGLFCFFLAFAGFGVDGTLPLLTRTTFEWPIESFYLSSPRSSSGIS